MDILNESKFQARQVAYCTRADTAQRWARRLLWLTFAIGLFAVWQHRELAPPVHDGMFLVSNVATDIWGGAHETRGVVQNLFSSGSDNGGSQEFNAITRWLLDNR